VTFWEIYPAVFWEAFLWGAGTAIGELPPYFVARAASQAGNTAEELEELLEGDKESQSRMDKIKLTALSFLKKHAFITVMFAASIPNPLFDLAGLTCGHFQIPFCVFFLSTFIGKAINKVSIQVVFMIIAFSKDLLSNYLTIVNNFSPKLADALQANIEKQQTSLFAKKDLTATPESEPIIK
jgi:vacuole membrane protein 1